MRKVFLFLILFVTGYARAQNLVPNLSFEDTVACPFDEDLFFYCKGWSSYRNTPDYFNKCTSSSNVGVPRNTFGYQYPASGNSYAGIITFYQGNYREVIGSKLSTSLALGVKYFVTMKISHSNMSLFSTDKLGISFSTIPYGMFINQAPINNKATIYTVKAITDTTKWVQVSGSFIADSAYEYIMIGNFFDDGSTDTIRVLGGTTDYYISQSYYYIDDVCVSPDSLTCNFGTGIKSTSSSAFNIYPHPANDKIYFSTNFSGSYSYSLINLLGEEIKSSPSSGASALDVTDVPSGIYILRISYHDKTIQRKQVVLH